jgi:hypothetical protein
MFKHVYKSVCISTILVSPNTLSATPPTSSAVQTPENTEGNLMTLKHQQHIKEMSKWNTPLVSCEDQVDGR